MSINITVYPDEGYYISKYVGTITDMEMMDVFRRFFTSDEWVPGMSELADISEADLTEITSKGLSNLADMVEKIFSQHNISMRVAVYAPHDLGYGMARVYSTHAERFETHEVFRDLDEAKEWLLNLDTKNA